MAELGLTPSLRPSVGFTDTFYKPAAPDTSGLNALQDTLDNFAGRVNKFAAEQQEVMSAEELAEGKAAYDLARTKMNGAINAGEIPAGATPHFRRGWRLNQLSNLATSIDGTLRQEYAASAVRNSDNVDEVSAWYRTRSNELLMENGAEGYSNALLSEAFWPALQRGETNLNSLHVKDRIKVAEEGAALEFDISIQNTLQAVQQNGGWEAAPQENAQAVGNALQEKLDAMVANGMSPHKANGILADALLAHAQDVNDPDVLEAAAFITTGTGKLSGTSKWREASERLEDNLHSESERRVRFDQYRVDKARTENTRALQSQIILQLLEDPSTDITADLKALGALDASKVNSLDQARWRMMENKERIVEDTDAVAHLNWLAVNDPDNAERMVMAGAGSEYSTETVKSTLALISTTRQNGGIFSDSIIAGELGALKYMILGTREGENAESAEAWRRANRVVKTTLLQWITTQTVENGGALPSRTEIYDAVARIADRAARHYTPTIYNTTSKNAAGTEGQTSPSKPKWAESDTE